MYKFLILFYCRQQFLRKQFFDYKRVMEFAKQSVGKQIAKRNVFLCEDDFNETYNVKMMVSDAPNKVIAKEFGISELTMNTRIYRLRNGLKRYISTALHPGTICQRA